MITTDHCFHEGEWGLCQTESDYINPDGVHIIRLPFAFRIPYKINKQIGIFKGFYPLLEKIQPDVIFVHNLQFQDIRKVAKYKKNAGTEKLKKYDYTSYEDDVPYYTMIIQEDGRKIKLLLDLTEEMLHTMKTQFPERVYFA